MNEKLQKSNVLKSTKSKILYRVLGVFIGFFVVMFVVFQVLFLGSVLPHGGLF